MFKSEGRIIFIMQIFSPHVISEYAEAWGKAYALKHAISIQSQKKKKKKQKKNIEFCSSLKFQDGADHDSYQSGRTVRGIDQWFFADCDFSGHSSKRRLRRCRAPQRIGPISGVLGRVGQAPTAKRHQS
ncbi:hypothetical protein P875_00053683 [Aspergillus parasiticus SU-1]|uniref:Uncharacterized protein n=1 Tax=Aspergillus parasiticus (strain ATCC 56775 / NRRL 5862 / SRRC 143 / SU-1) TaxID=1403190 RepID=A0A0F0HXG5_ASPPU|nr:hypothetical protein P875_00053683 [Aspergillus parasiticus SU-1]